LRDFLATTGCTGLAMVKPKFWEIDVQ
jgi:hypothetical protein